MEYDVHTLLDLATLAATIWVIYMMRVNLNSSYMHEKDNVPNYYIVIPCALLSLVVHPTTQHHIVNRILWAFCVYLEAVSVLPQLRVMQSTKIVEPFTAHYVFALGVARFLSCAHWILQVLDTRGRLLTALGYGLWPSMVLLSEIVQTFILADFCYYYVQSVMGGQLVLRLPSGVISFSLGETPVLMERFDFRDMLKAVERFKVTYMSVLPSLMVALAKSEMTTLAEHTIVAGAENRPPMLEKLMYDSWESRIRLFIKGKKHGRMMLNSIDNGLLVYPTVEENGQTRPKKYSELTEAQQLQDDCDVQETNIILHGLSPDVYALVNHQEAAKNIWDRVKMLIKGIELSYQERECRLYNLFDKFPYVQGETLYEYYWRFSQLINDMHTIGMTMQQV
nr:putative ER lumen protein-retaining receptor C28H8.4 [Tanacetum cinerariifolium]